MKKGMILALAVLILFSSAGCKSFDEFVRPESQEDTYVSGPMVHLTAQEKFYLQTWHRAAKLAEDVDDYEMAMSYYTKLEEYFPDTKEGIQAKVRLDELKNASREKEDAPSFKRGVQGR